MANFLPMAQADEIQKIKPPKYIHIMLTARGTIIIISLIHKKKL